MFRSADIHYSQEIHAERENGKNAGFHSRSESDANANMSIIPCAWKQRNTVFCSGEEWQDLGRILSQCTNSEGLPASLAPAPNGGKKKRCFFSLWMAITSGEGRNFPRKRLVCGTVRIACSRVVPLEFVPILSVDSASSVSTGKPPNADRDALRPPALQ